LISLLVGLFVVVVFLVGVGVVMVIGWYEVFGCVGVLGLGFRVVGVVLFVGVDVGGS